MDDVAVAVVMAVSMERVSTSCRFGLGIDMVGNCSVDDGRNSTRMVTVSGVVCWNKKKI